MGSGAELATGCKVSRRLLGCFAVRDEPLTLDMVPCQ
jgi:hypothetical protein